MKTSQTCRQCGLEIVVGLDGLCAECVALKDKPDELSKQTNLRGVPFKDMKQVDEQDRFKLIAGHVTKNPGKSVAVFVECGGEYKGKGDRYIAGVKAIVPKVTVQRKPGPVIGTETLVYKL